MNNKYQVYAEHEDVVTTTASPCVLPWSFYHQDKQKHLFQIVTREGDVSDAYTSRILTHYHYF